MSSVLEPLYLGFHAALAADGALSALVGTRIYDTIAPPAAVFPRITIDSPSEDDFRTFGNAGNDDSWLIHLWDRTANATAERPTNSSRVNVMYGHVERILNMQRLAIGGMSHVVGRTRLINNGLDEDGITRHGVVRYTALSFA